MSEQEHLQVGKDSFKGAAQSVGGEEAKAGAVMKP